MDTTSVEEKFHSAVDIIRSLPKSGSIQPSNDTKLKFYSYYKQATEGPCEIPKPAFWDIVNRAKWDAWNKLGSMSKEEAMTSYVQEFVAVLQNHSLNDLDDPTVINEYANMMGPYLEYAPKEIQESYILINGKSKKPLNNNSDDVYPAPVNGHNLNGTNESDSDEFSDTLERVNEEEPAEIPVLPNKPANNNSALNSKGPNIVTVRGGGDQNLGGAEGNSPAGGPSGSRGSRFSRQPRNPDYPLQAASNSNLISGAGGSRRSGGDLPTELSADVGEQLTLAVLRLQQIMEQVVQRLDNLETLLIEKSSNKSTMTVPTKNQSRWSFFGINPKLAILILAWPFIAQWLMYMIRKRQRHS